MNVKIDELMVSRVLSATEHDSVGHVKELMNEHGISSTPVLDAHGAPAGIVTARDLLGDFPEDALVGDVMSKPVYTVPRYGDPSLAARIMRNHDIHHVVVTEDKAVVGILSSFDLLRLVEDHRYVAKNPPTPSSRKGGSRRKAELGASTES